MIVFAGDVRQFNVLPVYDVNETEDIEAVQLELAELLPEGGPDQRRLTAEEGSRIDDVLESVINEGRFTSEPGASDNGEFGDCLTDFWGEAYYTGADDMVCWIV